MNTLKRNLASLSISILYIFTSISLVMLGLYTLDVPRDISYWRLAIGLVILWSAVSVSDLYLSDSVDPTIPPLMPRGDK